MNNRLSKFLVASGILGAIAGFASVASADTLTDAVDDTVTQVSGYAVPLATAVVTVALAFVAIRLIPRAIRMISARFGG